MQEIGEEAYNKEQAEKRSLALKLRRKNKRKQKKKRAPL